MNAIELHGVCKSFGSVHAVRNLDMTIPQGFVYGFLGPNGAGKTTTIRMLMNILIPDQGRISILNHPDASAAKERIGYMPEERGLYGKMRVEELLRYLGGIHSVPRDKLKERIGQWLERVGLAADHKRRVEELSKGNQQKIQFVSTVLHDPELLILDEPFSGLDPVNVELLRNIITDYRDRGRTVIFSTHMMEEAERLCDRILLINDGLKVADDTLAGLQERYRTRSVIISCQDQPDFLETLPMVQSVQSNGRTIEIAMADGYTPQDLLEALVPRTKLHRFEVKQPSLAEIFIHIVGQCDA